MSYLALSYVEKMLTVLILGHSLAGSYQRLTVYPSVSEGYLLGTADFNSLMILQNLYIIGGVTSDSCVPVSSQEYPRPRVVT